jgi:hypothetical protein
METPGCLMKRGSRGANCSITCLTDAIEPAMYEFEMATLAEADLFGRLGAACGGGKH